MNIEDMIAVLEAYRDGKQIQKKAKSSWHDWPRYDNEPMRLFDDGYEYRIKPEPKEIWVNEYKGSMGSHAHRCKEDAEAACIYGNGEADPLLIRAAVHYREIVDE